MINDLIKELDAIFSVHSNSYYIKDAEEYIDLLEKKFPFRGSKISWNSLDSSISRKINLRNYVVESIDFYKEIREKYFKKKKDEIVVLGDNVMDFGITTTSENLEEILKVVLNLPQHTYILNESAQWCMVFEMEGYADFAFSKNNV